MSVLEASTSTCLCPSVSDADISILCLCSHDPEDVSWTKTLKDCTKLSGFHDIFTTLDLECGYKQIEVIHSRLKTTKRLIIVLSKSSTGNVQFMNIVQCSVIFVLDQNVQCRIIPVLLSEDTEIPFMLLNREPFHAWKDDIERLVKSLVTSEEHLRSYIHNVIQLFQKGHYLHHLNQCILPPDVSKHTQELGLSVLRWWGLELLDKRLIVKMKRLQMIGCTQKILLHDLFSGLLLSKAVRFIRVTGFSYFDYDKFRRQEDLFEDLVNLYISIFQFVSNNRFWYNYRRHGISHTTNLAIYPVSKAITCVNIENCQWSGFNDYESRLQSLHNFPLENEEYRVKLAFAGFFYFGYFDYVQCFVCGACFRTWGLNRDPISRHATLFPLCPHVQKILTENKHDLVSEPKPNHSIQSAPLESISKTETKKVDILPACDYNTDYIDPEKRLKTIQEFKKKFGRFDIKDSILEEYANAGFYHYGVKEDILCFSCNLGIGEISSDENPWCIHANLAPNCPYLGRVQDTPTNISERSLEILLESYMEYEIITRE